METENGTGAPVDSELVESPELTVESPGPEPDAGATPAQEPTGFNPAWGSLREAIGEDHFDVYAKPLLQGMDESANTRITNLNAKLKPLEGYAAFAEQGIQPDYIQAAVALAQMAESDPQGLYERLSEMLGVNAEQEPESLDEFGANQENAAEIPPHILNRLEQAERFQQEFMQQQQMQQQQHMQQQQIEQEGARLDKEMSDFLSGNPSFTKADEGELFRLQYELTRQLESRGINRLATLEEAAAAFNERAAMYRNRGGSGAPGVLPPTAGGNIPQQQPDVGKMNTQDFNKLIAADLAKLQS